MTQPGPESSGKARPPSLSESLRRVLCRNPASALPVGDFLCAVEGKGFGVLLMLLALPSALPVPAPGYSVPFGCLMALLAIQMLCGRKTPWIPARARAWTLRRSLAESMANGAEAVFGRLERFIKPRPPHPSSRGLRLLQGALVLFMALLMCIPIPLTNTAPAGVIFLLGLGISEEDGYLTLAACMLGLAAAALYAGVVAVALYLFFNHGRDGLNDLKDTLLAWLSA